MLGLSARKCGTDQVLFTDQMHADRKEDVADVLGRMTGRFRALAGESPDAFKPTSPPLFEATTSSLDALRAYSAGRTAISTKGPRAAAELLKRAVSLDPQFALAHSFLGSTYASLVDMNLAQVE